MSWHACSPAERYRARVQQAAYMNWTTQEIMCATNLTPQHSHFCNILHVTHSSCNVFHHAVALSLAVGLERDVRLDMHGVKQLPCCCGGPVSALRIAAATALSDHLLHASQLQQP